MGQTLTHGIYLPDEGERNCYNGLAGNWQLLDGAVGTIAEHSTQIAGKAPLVHTHTKSDITDLFNSANVWSANQTISNDTAALIIKNPQMTLGVSPASSLNSSLFFHDVNNTSIGYIQLKNHNNSNNMLSLVVKNKNGADSYECALRFRITKYGDALLYPENASCGLGSTTQRWKTLNGVNPGALSLPDSASFVDISSSITNLDGTDNFYTPSVNGWISVCVSNNSPSLSMYCDRNNSWGASFAPTNTNTIFGILPLVAGNRVRIRTVCGALIYARFYPCLGNV